MKLGMHAGQDTSITQYVAFDGWLGGQQLCVTRNVFCGDTTWSDIASPYMLSDGVTSSWLSKGPQYQEVIGVAMCPGSGGASGVTLAMVAGGAGDTYWTQLGQNINKYLGSLQNQVVLRLGWEMNGDWYQWGYGSANSSWNNVTDFIAAWKRIVPLIKANAPGVRFEWCPSSGRGITGGLSGGYPGNAYVDIIGLDMYDQYDTGGWLNVLNGGSGITLGGLAGLRSFAASMGKPEAYTEWGLENTSNGHQDNPTFILGMYCFMKEGSNVDHQCLWNSHSGGPNAGLFGTDPVPVITGSISGTTLTVTNIANGSPGLYHFLTSADPVHNDPIIPGTQITAGTSSPFTVNNAQTVRSQTINVQPAPKSAQLYQTLFSKQPAVQLIGSTLQNGVLVPSVAIPPNYGCLFDGTNFHVALK